jgi:hypothetical protein
MRVASRMSREQLAQKKIKKKYSVHDTRSKRSDHLRLKDSCEGRALVPRCNSHEFDADPGTRASASHPQVHPPPIDAASRLPQTLVSVSPPPLHKFGRRSLRVPLLVEADF